MRDSRRHRGFTNVLLLTGICILYGVYVYFTGRDVHKPDFPRVGVALVAAVGGSVFEIRRDLYRASKAGVVAAAFLVLVFGIALLDQRRTWVDVLGFCLATALLVTSRVLLRREQRLPDPLPNALRAQWGDQNVYEWNGLQVVPPQPQKAREGEVALFRLPVQNCFDGVRTVSVRVRPTPFNGVKTPSPRPLTIGPLEVGELLIPVELSAPVRGEYVLRVELTIQGGAGRRRRRWRGGELALRAGKHVEGGSGIVVALTVDRTPVTVGGLPPSVVRTEVEWAQDLMATEAVRRAAA